MVEHARAVIIGGGVGGTSIAYHLAERGWTDIVLVDRAELTSGSTFHSAGLVGQLRGSVTLTRMMMYGVELYRRLAAETGVDPSWHEVGSLRLASSPARFEELQRQAGWAQDVRAADRADLGRRGPGPVPVDVDRRRARRASGCRPTAGSTRPSLALALAAGAAARGVDDPEPPPRRRRSASRDGRVTGVEVEHDGERSTIEAEVVVNAGGMYAPEIGRLAGITMPDRPDGAPVPASPGRSTGVDAGPAPAARPGQPRLLPRGGRRAVHGRLRARPGAVGARRHPGRLQPPAARRPTGRGSSEIMAGAIRRVPAIADAPRHADDQRPRGLHARQRVHPRRVGGPRACSSPPGSAPTASPAPAASAARSRRGSSTASPSSTCGRWTSAGSAPQYRQPLVHARPERRELRDLLRHPLPERGAPGRPAAARVAGVRAARGARGVVRREGRLGAGELVRAERRRRAAWRRPRTSRRSGRAAGRASTGARRSAPRRWRRGRPPRCSTRRRSRRSRSSGRARRRCCSGCAPTTSTARSAASSTPSC